MGDLARQIRHALYVYSRRTLTGHFPGLAAALRPLDHRVCFAVKANSNLAVLRTLAVWAAVSTSSAKANCGASWPPAATRATAFSPAWARREGEIQFALRRGVYCFNAESEAELARINRVAARLRKIAPVAVRVNPGIDAHTHAKITTGTYENKFGIPLERVEAVYARAARLRNLRLRGLQMHIGSQLTRVEPFEAAVKKVSSLVRTLSARHGLEFFSIGGGAGHRL